MERSSIKSTGSIDAAGWLAPPTKRSRLGPGGVPGGLRSLGVPSLMDLAQGCVSGYGRGSGPGCGVDETWLGQEAAPMLGHQRLDLLEIRMGGECDTFSVRFPRDVWGSRSGSTQTR